VCFSGSGLHSCYETKGLCIKDCQTKAMKAIESREIGTSFRAALNENRKRNVGQTCNRAVIGGVGLLFASTCGFVSKSN